MTSARRVRRLLRQVQPGIRAWSAEDRPTAVAVTDLTPASLRRPRARAVAVAANAAPAVTAVDVGGVPGVGPNLCAPLLGTAVGTRGKHFVVAPAKAPPSGGGRRKAYKEFRISGDDVLRQTLTVWDLLLPMLHPPLPLHGDPGTCDLPHRLYHYQVDGIRFLCESASALLADEMGTGKTVMSTVALRLLFRENRVRRALVLCPLSVLGVWDRHLADWAPDLAVTIVHGGARRRWADWRCPAHVYLTTYDTLRADVFGAAGSADPVLPVDVQQSFDLVLLDEAQAIKNAGSGRTRAVLRLSPKIRWALSGTPVENRLADLASVFSFVRPRLLPHEDLSVEMAADLIGPYVKRRTKRDVMKELPPKIRQDEWLELDRAQRLAYEAAEQAGIDQLEGLGDKLSRVHVFTLITRLKMICNFAPGAATSPKLRSTLDKVESIHDAGQKVLIFTQWVGHGVDRIAAALEPFGVVAFDARLSSVQREAAIDRFRSDPSITAFVATVKSAGVGLTLTEASYVIHFDHWWNPAWMWQAEDRAHRRGQTLPVNVYSLWMSDTIEQRVHDLLQKKGVLQEQVLDGLSESAIDGLITAREWMDVLRRPR